MVVVVEALDSCGHYFHWVSFAVAAAVVVAFSDFSMLDVLLIPH